LDGGRKLPFPDGILINGRGRNGYYLTVEQGRPSVYQSHATKNYSINYLTPRRARNMTTNRWMFYCSIILMWLLDLSATGKTYRLRISNVGLQNSLNFRIQNHKMKLVEVEGTHTLQTTYSSLDVHVGQSYSVLFTADQPGQDYYIVVTSRFTSTVLNTTGILHYSNSAGAVSGPFPGGPTIEVDWSLNQARSIRYILIPPNNMLFEPSLKLFLLYLWLYVLISGLILLQVDQGQIHKAHTTMEWSTLPELS
jgi:hypothetical protein